MARALEVEGLDGLGRALGLGPVRRVWSSRPSVAAGVALVGNHAAIVRHVDRAPGRAGVPGRAVERDDLGLHIDKREADVLVGVLVGHALDHGGAV